MKLNEFYGKQNQHWELIYKASWDGLDTNAFHTRCYIAVAWTSEGGSYKNDIIAFLFPLTNPHKIPPTKYSINPYNAGNAIYNHSNYEPTFGNHALYLANNINSNNSSYTDLSEAYIDATGTDKNTFTGAKNFAASGIEVFSH